MKKYLARIAVLAAMLAAWHFDIGGLKSFIATMVWVWAVLCLLISFFYSYTFSNYDDGKLSKKDWDSLIKDRVEASNLKNYSVRAFSAVNIALLIFMGFGITAGAYLVSSLIGVAVTNGCKKRAEPPK